MNGLNAVYTAGNVGIGTTTPTSALEVNGTGRFTNTVTLNPASDQALNLSTGSVYKGGIPFLHNKGGANNTALGLDALASITSGSNNTATGFQALVSNTIGSSNTASGTNALLSNTTGTDNTASGREALFSNTIGSSNTASGTGALFSNTTGNENTAFGSGALVFNTQGFSNTASGTNALLSNTTGNSNTASGKDALDSNTTGSNNTAIGKQALGANTIGAFNTAIGFDSLSSNTTASSNLAIGAGAGKDLTTGGDNIMIDNHGTAADVETIRIGKAPVHGRTFIAGIRGVTTANANAIAVLVDSAGQLGTVSSSRRFKEDIRDMGTSTDRLLDLRPVLFKYKQDQTLPEGSSVPPEYGLIAEEVAQIFPDLVVYDEKGAPFTVKYHILSSMLLNEAKKMKAEHKQLKEEHKELRDRVTRLESVEAELASLRAQVSALAEKR
ncbi:MAG: tail fiber domain-containing protein [Planctomycetota bacterium]